MQKLECPKCGGAAVSPEGLMGEKVCINCGLVIKETPVARHFSQWSPEWPSKYNEEDSETLREWLTALRMVSCQLNLPNFPYREEAARALRKESQFFLKSQRFAKNKRATVAALVHLILREYGKERSIKEICQQLQLDSKLVMKQGWTLKERIGTPHFLQAQRKSSKDYLYECGGKITSDNHLLLTAEESLAKVQKKGGNPVSIAAGAFYYACKAVRVRINKKVIGKAFSVSHRTVDTNERRIRRLIGVVATK